MDQGTTKDGVTALTDCGLSALTHQGLAESWGKKNGGFLPKFFIPYLSQRGLEGQEMDIVLAEASWLDFPYFQIVLES